MTRNWRLKKDMLKLILTPRVTFNSNTEPKILISSKIINYQKSFMINDK